MPKSSRHKSHKQSKHSSRDYSDSEEDVIKMKEKSSKDENSVRVHRDSASGEKRKVSSQLREGKDSKDLGGHGNGEVLEEYVSSKRRKEKTDVVIGGDRWNGGGDERGDSDRNVDKETHKGEMMKVDQKLKENSSKGESLRIESKSKSKRNDSGVVVERKEDGLASVVVDKEESKSKGESKRRSERESSSRKDGKDTKEKDRRSDKEKNGGQESKSSDAEVKLVDVDLGKKQGLHLGDFSEDRQGKRPRDNTGKVTFIDSLVINAYLCQFIAYLSSALIPVQPIIWIFDVLDYIRWLFMDDGSTYSSNASWMFNNYSLGKSYLNVLTHCISNYFPTIRPLLLNFALLIT